MSRSRFTPAEEFHCELNLTLEANTEMINDDVSDTDIKESILNGEKTENYHGGGAIYRYGVIVVVADSEPCHFYVITVWKINTKKPSYKNKPYRIRRYMRRKQRGLPCPRCGKAELTYSTYPLEISGKIYGEFDGCGCPNCGIVYFSEESSKKIREVLQSLRKPVLDPKELILVLLYSSKEPIRGAVCFMKEAFLLFKEKLQEFDVPALSPNFISYHYGPYSFDIDEAWHDLEEIGLIAIEGRRSSNKETFYLTREGKTEAKEIYDSLPEDLKKELPEWRRGLDELGNDGILKDVYLKYHEYTDKSKIKKQVLSYGMHGRA
ncbi:MAG: hypothetical protein C4B59_01545 [Candidatus Methanogaster sp.]|uniref:Uncharacterized protein n=1 Tax=Candidatus Methanogaster sp. TaxID=3386292 RepID=A0AC61L6B7_9EURY|nr:MAG: hypothetical protein C4B59_01545 [ANME-2 cluster archaeon]